MDFSFEGQAGYFAVLAGNLERMVRCSLQQDQIEFSGEGIELDLVVTLTLNNEGDCRLRVNGNGEYTAWQVLRKALEGLFFDLPTKR